MRMHLIGFFLCLLSLACRKPLPFEHPSRFHVSIDVILEGTQAGSPNSLRTQAYINHPLDSENHWMGAFGKGSDGNYPGVIASNGKYEQTLNPAQLAPLRRDIELINFTVPPGRTALRLDAIEQLRRYYEKVYTLDAYVKWHASNGYKNYQNQQFLLSNMTWGLEKVQSLGPLLGTWAYTGPLLGLVGGSITRGQGTAEAQETAICLSLTRANEIIQRLDNAKNEIVTIVEHGSTDASGTERFSESGFTAWRQKLLTALNEAESFERSVPPLAGNQAGQPKEKPSSPQPTEPATTTQPPPAKTPPGP